MLDSDVLIDYLRGAGHGRELVATLRDRLAFRVTAVTALELALGNSYARDPRPVDASLGAPCLPLNQPSGLRAGKIMRKLQSTGEAIDVRDAICLVADAPLVTRNTRHLSRVPGLAVLSIDRGLLRSRD